MKMRLRGAEKSERDTRLRQKYLGGLPLNKLEAEENLSRRMIYKILGEVRRRRKQKAAALEALRYARANKGRVSTRTLQAKFGIYHSLAVSICRTVRSEVRQELLSELLNVLESLETD